MKQLGALLTISGALILMSFFFYSLPLLALTIGWESVATFGEGYTSTFIVYGTWTMSDRAFELYFFGMMVAIIVGKVGLLAFEVGLSISAEANKLMGKPPKKIYGVLKLIRPSNPNLN